MGRLDGKVAIITGGAMGQGEAEARLFAREGARVVIGDIVEEQGNAVALDIGEQGGEALFVRLDVASEDDWRRAVEIAVEAYGRLDILVNNAGIRGPFGIEDLSLEDWDRVVDVNQKGVFLGTKHSVPAMRKGGGGSIVNISSVAAIRGRGSAAYSATKGAVRTFTKVTAIHYAKDNIRCNSVHPGPVDTAFFGDALQDQAVRDRTVRPIPMGRLCTPEDVAYAVLYLASDDASFVTGAELVVDGGRTAM